MIETLLVALIVAAAALYSAWVLMPAAWRRAGAARLARRASRAGVDPATARGLQHRLERAGGCGDCASCKGCGSDARPQPGSPGVRRPWADPLP